MPLDQDSSRRAALIEVDFIDTDKLEKINWHKFYSDFVKEGAKALKNKQYAWKLSQEDIDLQYQENERFRAPNELELILREVFDFEHPYPGLKVVTSKQTDNNYLRTRSDIIGCIKQKYPNIHIKVPALVNTLEQLCGKYTHTIRGSKILPNCSGAISN